MKLSKIYTKGGDKGQTSLVGGSRISKGSLKVECYGTSDELNSYIGVIRTLSAGIQNKSIEEKCTLTLPRIQNKLFDLGSLLATESGKSYASMPVLDYTHVEELERDMDQMNESLENLSSFTLPGGSLLNAHAHVARTVCRRLERQLVRLQDEDTLPENALIYINRLSDWLFVFSRWVIKKEGQNEYLWEKESREK